MRADRHDARGYHVVPFPALRVPVVDSLRAGRRKPLMHALVEVDVTAARALLREHKRRTGEALSFTAFLIGCVARAVAQQKEMQAYRRGTRRLVLFDDVDVCTPIEHHLDNGARQATPYVIRAADRKTLRAVHGEIRAVQAAGIGGRSSMRLRRIYPHLPRPLRAAFWWAFERYPRLQRRIGGTVLVTAVGMFGAGVGWGISPISDYTLQVVVGAIGKRPGVVDGRIEVREYLCLTVSADHDVVDGAPMARFVQRLRELIEGGSGLKDLEGAGDADREAAAVTAAHEAAGAV